LVGSGGTILTGGGGNDSITVAAGVKLTSYSVQGGTNNDTLVINGILAGGGVQGNEGADSIVLGASSVLGGVTIQVDNATIGPMGADTLVLGNLNDGAFNNSKITQFSKANDTLFVGTIQISGADFGSLLGTYTGASLTSGVINASGGDVAKLFSLDSFLANNGTASITII
jgi:hypothetical protein